MTYIISKNPVRIESGPSGGRSAAHPGGSKGKLLGILSAVAAAVALTVLNAAKPMHLDDVVHWYFASQVVKNPADMYDFEIHWQQIPQPAQNPIAPPVLAYWWAAGIRLFGQDVVLWKLWLFPFSLALTLSMGSLFRRFARGLEHPLVWMSALSPTILPSLNLCVEVPSMALAVSAVALFVRACDRRSGGTAILAGVFCGLAMQTKWTAFTVPATFFLYAAVTFRPRLWLLATGIAVFLFVSWESYIAFETGESHFLHQMRISNPTKEDKALLLPLITYVGGTAPAVALIGLAALGASRRFVIGAGLAVILGYGLLLIDPGSGGIPWRNPLTGRPWSPRVDTPVFLVLGAFVWGTMLAVTLRSWRPFRTMTPWKRKGPGAGWFLVAWLGLEIVGYFVLSPFGATRRIISVVFVLTLLTGRLASLTCRRPDRRALIRWSAAFGVVLGLFYQAIDTAEALAGENALKSAADWIHAEAPNATGWFSGFWNAEFYGLRNGLKPVILGQSDLKPGDFLAVVDVKGLEGNRYTIDDRHAVLERTIEWPAVIPYTTVPCYYIGRRPLEHLDGSRVVVRVFRVTAPFHPSQEFETQGKPRSAEAPAK